MASLSIGRPHRRMSGFTLIELLVVIGIIALLIGILLPSLNRARRNAKDIVCANNIRQFVLADNMYLADNKVYPLPCINSNPGPTVLVWPYLFDGATLNVMGNYLHLKNPIPGALSKAVAAGIPLGAGDYPLLAYQSQINAAKTSGLVPTWGQLPKSFKAVEFVDNWGDNPLFTNAQATPDTSYSPCGYYAYSHTGYSNFTSASDRVINGLYKISRPAVDYVVGSNAAPSTSSVDTFMHPEDIGTRKHRGVLWADSVFYYGLGSNWEFAHSKKAGLTTSPNPTDIRGQHCAYSDGSVVFCTNTNMLTSSTNVQLTATMCYKGQAFWWATLNR